MRRTIGIALVLAGVLLAGYAALVVTRGDPVTGYLEGRTQARLRQELRAVAGPARGRTAKPDCRRREGRAWGLLTIPRTGLSAVVVVGGRDMLSSATEFDSGGPLSKGPAWYPWTSCPGGDGRVGIAGHRTTWGAPFMDNDRLRPGDPIYLRMPYGRFEYRVRRLLVVQPSDVGVLRGPAGSLVLTACTPKYSAAERLIVVAGRVR